jgi:hypothetical protein
VKLSDIREYEEPDLSSLKIESRCLAKDSDQIWYPAQIVDSSSTDHTFTVKFDSNDATLVLEFDCIVPLGVFSHFSVQCLISSLLLQDLRTLKILIQMKFQ